MRKGYRLPVPSDAVSFTGYSGREKSLDILREGMQALIVDE